MTSSQPPVVAPERPAAIAPPVDHYENFPVASWLCPPRLRPAIAAIYAFARTADDLADEGDAPAPERLAALAALRADLQAAARGDAPSPRWPQVFGPLAAVIAQFGLPVPLLDDLLCAFEQDVIKTQAHAGYADRADCWTIAAARPTPSGACCCICTA